MEKGIWYLDNRSKFRELDKDIKTDVLIVGGGLTGVNLLYYLKDSKKKITLIEGNSLLSSTTMKSTAKLTYLQEDLLSKIKKCYGESRAFLYYKSQKNAIEEVCKIIKDEKIECDLESSPSYLYIKDKKNLKRLMDEAMLYKKFGSNITMVDKLPLEDEEIYKGFYVNDTYTFHPVKYGYGLVNIIKKYQNIDIYENTRMNKFYYEDGLYKVLMQNGKVITCNDLVIANNYPSFLFPYLFPFKTYLERSDIAVLKHDNLHFNAINLDKDTTSIRFYNDYIIKIISSRKLNTEYITSDKGSNYSYSNHDVITPDSLPIVDKLKKHLYIGTGYNTWGMTNSNMAARILRDLLEDKENQFYQLTCIKRKSSIVRYFNILGDMLSGAINFLSSYLVPRDSATIQVIDGKKYGVYRDDKGKKHIVSLTCTHMKCGLHFNKEEKTWDCPCHGSRFDIDGNIIRGPSTDCVSRDILF